MVALIFGTSVFGYIVGQASTVMAKADSISEQLSRKFEQLATFLEEKRLPHQLKVGARCGRAARGRRRDSPSRHVSILSRVHLRPCPRAAVST